MPWIGSRGKDAAKPAEELRDSERPLEKWGEPTITAKETRVPKGFEEEFPKANHDAGWDPKKWDPDKDLERWVPWENVPPFLDTITYVLQRPYNFYLFALSVLATGWI